MTQKLWETAIKLYNFSLWLIGTEWIGLKYSKFGVWMSIFFKEQKFLKQHKEWWPLHAYVKSSWECGGEDGDQVEMGTVGGKQRIWTERWSYRQKLACKITDWLDNWLRAVKSPCVSGLRCRMQFLVGKGKLSRLACCHGSRGKAGQLISFGVISNVEKMQLQGNTFLFNQKHRKSLVPQYWTWVHK